MIGEKQSNQCSSNESQKQCSDGHGNPPEQTHPVARYNKTCYGR